MSSPGEKEDEFFYYLDPDTHEVQKIRTLTGEVVSRTPRHDDHLIIKGAPMPMDELKRRQHTWVYNTVYKDLICQYICEGLTLTDICKKKYMPPPYILARWRSENPELTTAMNEAKRMRAEMMADEIRSSIGDDVEQKDVAAERLKYDKQKWLSSVDDPDVYGNRVKHSGDNEQPLQVVLNTGINRDKPIQLENKDDDIIEGEVNNEPRNS